MKSPQKFFTKKKKETNADSLRVSNHNKNKKASEIVVKQKPAVSKINPRLILTRITLKKVTLGINGLILIVLFLIAFLLPGQNYYQTLNLKAEKPKVRDISLNVNLNDYPKVLGIISPPILSAESVIIMDVNSGVVLYEKNPESKLKPASLTKIMTALIALDNYLKEDVLEVKTLDAEGAQMGLKVGDKLTFENLLKGLLINSGNDAAYTIAENFNGGIEQFSTKDERRIAFINSMNSKALELNMYNTHYANINGFDDENHYTTSLDLARLSVYALKNPVLSKIVSTVSENVSDVTGKRWYQLTNVNKLLGTVNGVIGIKTGYTEEAGECLVTDVNRDGRQILTVILKSKDRFGETDKLIEWTYGNTKWEKEQF